MNELISSDDCDKLGLEKVKELYKKYVSFSQEKLASSFGYGHDLVDYAEGCWIYTKSGRKILDFTGGIGVLNHGHNHPRILKARLEFQKLKKMEVHKSFLSPYIAALSHNIAQILPEDLNVSFFPNSGAEAVDGAIKLAYKYHNGKRNHILHSDISFHGKLLGCGSLGGSPEFHFEFPKIPNTHAFEYNSIESVKRLLELLKKADGTSDIYAIILEPFSASSLRKCSSDFLYELQDLCRKNAIVLIFDEVYSGWAKTGELFYFMHFSNLVPDILATSKSLGGGKASISAYVVRDKIFRAAYDNLKDASLYSTTYYGFGEETITAIEAINIIFAEDYIGKSKWIHTIVSNKLKLLQKKYPEIISEIRGSGALNGFVIEKKPKLLELITKLLPSSFLSDKRFINKLVTAAIVDYMYEHHGILSIQGANIEIPYLISPSLIVTEDEINYFFDALDCTLATGISFLILRFIKTQYFPKKVKMKSYSI